MLTAVYIAIAGAVGTLCRYFVGLGLTRWSERFPFGTFAVNILGSFAIGIAMAVFAVRGELDSRMRLAITVGFLGGFTTYSAFALETAQYVERKQMGLAATYVGTTFVIAALACFGGLLLGRVVAGAGGMR